MTGPTAASLDEASLLQGLRDGERHVGGLRCRPLFTMTADVLADLTAEVEGLRRRHPSSTVARPDHVTNWVQPTGCVQTWSLLNRTGRTDDFAVDHDLSCRGKWFLHAEEAPTLARFLAEWPHLVNCRVNLLGPGAALAPHEEHVAFPTAAGTVGARLRFHLPLVTGDGAELVLDGEVFHLAAGVVHLVNQGCVHAARNRDATDRLHLVWDALLTRALLALLVDPPPADALRRPVTGPDLAPRGHEPVGPHRRQPPLVAPAALDALAPCEPQ